MLFRSLLAPFIPFLTESIYLELRRKEAPLSVHLTDFPRPIEELRDLALEEEMAWTQAVVNLGRSIRKEHQIKLRQPLPKMHVVTADQKILKALGLQIEIIREELNVKDVTLSLDETDFVALVAKPNFRVVGKKVGRHMPKVKELIEKLSYSEIRKLMEKEAIEINIEEETFSLTEEDILIEREVHEGLVASTFGPLSVVLDTHIDVNLYYEGIARELVNKINTMRKSRKLEVTDRIEVVIDAGEDVKNAYEKFAEFINGEVLATKVLFSRCDQDADTWVFDDHEVHIQIFRI